jgi:hypothetical protein
MIDHQMSLASEPDYKKWLLKTNENQQHRNGDRASLSGDFEEKRHRNSFDFVDIDEGMTAT